MTTTVGLLRLDDLPEHALHVRGDYPALYRHLFDAEDVELLDIAVHRGDVPASLTDADVWVLTGSRYSVGDDLDWIATATELLAELIRSEVPTVGICFGHQLLGRVAGGTVGRAEGWGVGVQEFRTVRPLPWFPEATRTVSLIASHQDQVLSVPDGVTVWSTSDYCPAAGLLVGERAWSVQGHPEFTPDVARVLYEGRRDRLGDTLTDEARGSLERPVSNRAVARAIVRFAAGAT